MSLVTVNGVQRILVPDNVGWWTRVILTKKDLKQVKPLRPSTWGGVPIKAFRKSELRKIIYLMGLQIQGE